jgi:LacI family transcriptional regulator, galactose operon repressor
MNQTSTTMSGRRVTLRHVAERAGVSFKTVSRVVNAEPGVSPELAARVRAAVDELGYRPDPRASGLRRLDRRTRTIAVVLEDLANPFSSELHRAVVDTARERDVLVLSASSDEDAATERAAVSAFLARHVDGVILMPTSTNHSWLQREIARGTQVVTVDRPIDGIEADAVVADNRAAATRATNHLLRRGHRHIAFLGDLRTIYTAGERMAGFREALTAAQLDPDSAPIRLDLRDSDSAEAVVIEILAGSEPPTAIFAAQNLLTIGAVRALRRLGLEHQVALVGFDDVLLADLLDPGVTVVAQHPGRIGAQAATLLLERIDGVTSPPGFHTVGTRLVPRGSGEIAPPNGAGDPFVSEEPIA